MNGAVPLGPKGALEDYSKMMLLLFSFLCWALFGIFIVNRHES